MFGGVTWMVNGNMACGVMGEDLMVRLDREEARRRRPRSTSRRWNSPAGRCGGSSRSAAAGIEGDADLGRWVDAGADYAESLPPK